ncbi:hypothetical protein DPMN_153333 [Dreissena polymorpha]|uniref:Uncharacterized protein n=1 Tax=Dreissena polymorpha TaxID=45954 RepID=A0A9D4FN10_DREPO|nr:hypothetical protein DPMN_153333 [Dreissena polymorpha]
MIPDSVTSGAITMAPANHPVMVACVQTFITDIVARIYVRTSSSVSTEVVQLIGTPFARNAMKTMPYSRNGMEIENVNECALGTITIAGPEHAAPPD